jgi:DNA-binding NarL/FixJ family response regulator
MAAPLPVSTKHGQSAPFRVLLVDDHPVTRRGLKAVIEQNAEFVVCGEAENSSAALTLAETVRPHVTLLDLSLPGGNGMELLRALAQKVPDARIIVLSMHDQKFYAEKAARAGAAGYVMKEDASSMILQALRTVVGGSTFFDQRTLARLKPQPSHKKSAAVGLDQLSPRELEVLRLIGTGFTTREIASQLGLSAKTVETYREHLKRKLEMVDGEMLVQFAIKWSAGESSASGVHV